MTIRRWQPIDAMETLRRQIDRVFDEFKGLSNDRSQTWEPAIELQDTPENLLLRVPTSWYRSQQYRYPRKPQSC